MCHPSPSASKSINSHNVIIPSVFHCYTKLSFHKQPFLIAKCPLSSLCHLEGLYSSRDLLLADFLDNQDPQRLSSKTSGKGIVRFGSGQDEFITLKFSRVKGRKEGGKEGRMEGGNGGDQRITASHHTLLGASAGLAHSTPFLR